MESKLMFIAEIPHDLCAESIKSLITVGSALIISTYIAFAQFCQASGKFSDLQTKAFFEYVIPAWRSVIAFLALIAACGLTSDHASDWMKCASVVLFSAAAYFHIRTLRLMYGWSKGARSSDDFVGDELRVELVRKWLKSDTSVPADRKAQMVLQHLEASARPSSCSEDRKPLSSADRKFAVTLFQETVLGTLSLYAKELKARGKSNEKFSERFCAVLHYTRTLHSLNKDQVDDWYSVDFVRSLARQVRDIRDAHSAPLYALHDHLTWLNRQIGGEDSVNLWRYKLYFDALIEEARHDYPPGLKSYTDAKSLLSMGLLCSVFDAVGTLGYNLKIPALASALDRKDVSVFGVFVRRCLVDHVRNLHSRGRVSLESPVRGLFASHLEDVSLNHLLRLIRLEGDILNAHADSFIDACAETSSGDGMVMLTNPPDDAQSEVRRIGKDRRDNAEYFYIPSSQTAHDLGLLADMRAAVEKRLESARGKNDDMAVAKAEETLRFLKEHAEFVEAHPKK
jgi:hypothetical protein